VSDQLRAIPLTVACPLRDGYVASDKWSQGRPRPFRPSALLPAITASPLSSIFACRGNPMDQRGRRLHHHRVASPHDGGRLPLQASKAFHDHTVTLVVSPAHLALYAFAGSVRATPRA